MRVPAVALVVFLLSPVAYVPSVEARDAQRNHHIRTDTADLAEMIGAGVARSPTLARVVADLGSSDVLAYVEFDDRLPSSLGGRTRLAAATAGVRYLRIGIRRMLTDDQRIAMLAHELGHALEIARAPQVVDARSMAVFYRAIGFPSTAGFDCYESVQAISTGSQVARELQRSRRHRHHAAHQSVRPTD